MRFSRFVLVGGVCALVNNALVIAFAHCGFGYLAATLLAFGPIVCIGYTLHVAFTFQTQNSWVAFARYALSMATNFPIWVAALYVLCDRLGVPVAIAAPVTTVFVFLWNFVSTKWALYVVMGAGRPAFRRAAERPAGWK